MFKLWPVLLVLAASAAALEKSPLAELAALEKQVRGAEVVEDLGTRAAAILEAAPAEASARLELVFAKQVRLLRERALERLRQASQADDFATQCSVESDFVRDVARSKPRDAEWDFAAEKTGLADAARLLIEHKKKGADLQLEAAKQQADYMRMFQTFASQIQQLQASQFSRGLPLQAGFAYRIQDNINLSGSYQQGKARLELQNLDDASVISGDPPFISAPSRGNFGFTFNAA
mmetsp:Transcript_12341/g.39266  ORF Transcript_12341/g.39266 Transcript_12341/m.39266 type:complete len:234 (-) Transcript_12341:102-803(-)